MDENKTKHRAVPLVHHGLTLAPSLFPSYPLSLLLDGIITLSYVHIW